MPQFKRIPCLLIQSPFETDDQLVDRITAALGEAGFAEKAKEFSSRVADSTTRETLLQVASKYVYDPREDEESIERWLDEGGALELPTL